MKIYCCGCQSEVEARLTSGAEIYPHRSDLSGLPFWKCYTCGNYVGCHHKTANPTRPLGSIPTPELREARKKIHAELDPLWKQGKIKRGDLYARISLHIGHEFHTSQINTLKEADMVQAVIRELA